MDSITGSKRNLATRRQLSQTQSEPDNQLNYQQQPPGALRQQTSSIVVKFAEPTINVIPPPPSQSHSHPHSHSHTQNLVSSCTLPVMAGNHQPSSSASSNRNRLMAMHTEYTSITDELESVCGLFSPPPRSPRLLSPPRPGQQQQQLAVATSGHPKYSKSLSVSFTLSLFLCLFCSAVAE